MSRIELENASVVIPAADERQQDKTVLRPVTLVLDEQRVAVIGANGSGKSTLLRLLNGLALPSTGSVRVDGLDSRTHGAALRRRVGFVFTDPLSQLVMPTPREDVELSLRRLPLGRADRRSTAEALLAGFGLTSVAESSIYELSGGERQLCALAAVLAVEPDVLVLDEPSTLLDLRNTRALRRRLAQLPQQIILSTHDLSLAADFERILVMDDGGIAYDGPPADAVAFYQALAR